MHHISKNLIEIENLPDDELIQMSSDTDNIIVISGLSDAQNDHLALIYGAWVETLEDDVRAAFLPTEDLSSFDLYTMLRINVDTGFDREVFAALPDAPIGTTHRA